MKNRIIKTDDKTYYVLEKITLENKNYVLLTECDLDKDEINTNDFLVKGLVSENSSLKLLALEDEEVTKIAPLLIQKYREEQA